jgi:ornithine cyclodeaminase
MSDPGQFRIINGAAVRKLLQYSDAVPAMADTFRGLVRGEVYQHPRVTVEPPDHGGAVLLMPATAGPRETQLLGLKMLSMFPRAGERGLPSVQGLVILLDAVHGRPVALVDALAVTEIRTAAVTAVATEAMARPDAEVLAIVGTGVQGAGHLEALAGVRRWRSVRLFSRTPDRAAALAVRATELGLPVQVCDTVRAAVSGADVVCTTTSACSPVLEEADLDGRGVHINAIGAFGPTCRELPTATVAGARLVVDDRAAALAEAGDVIIPIAEGAMTDAAIAGSLGEVLTGAVPGRVGDETTVFKSLGLPAQDAVACELIFRRAVQTGAGDTVSFP